MYGKVFGVLKLFSAFKSLELYRHHLKSGSLKGLLVYTG